MAKFAYSNTMHSSTQQTPFFANHGLHPKFDIQGVHKVVNPTIEDRAMWLVDVWAQLVFNLEEMRKQYKESWWTLEGTTKVQGWGPCLASTATYQNNKAIREVGSSKARSILHYETNQCHGLPTQASRFYENPSCVSCFLIGTLPHVYESKKNPWSPTSTYLKLMMNKYMKWETN